MRAAQRPATKKSNFLCASFGLADLGQAVGNEHAAQREQSTEFCGVFCFAVGEGDAGDEECDREADTGSGTEYEQILIGHTFGKSEDFTGDAAKGEDADHFADDQSECDASSRETDRGECDACAGPTEEAEDDFRRDIEEGLEFVERVFFAAFVVGVNTFVFFSVRHAYDDGDEAEGAVNAGITEAGPGHEHEQEVRYPAVPVKFFVEQEIADEHGHNGDAESVNGVHAEPRTEAECDDDESDGIVSNGEQEKEWDSGMAAAEDDAGDHGAESDIGRSGDSPSVHEVIGGAGAHFVTKRIMEEESDEQIDADGTEDAAGGCNERCCGLFGVMECAARESSFKNFLACGHKEESHQEVIDKEVNIEVFQPASIADVRAEPWIVHKSEMSVQDVVISFPSSFTAVSPDKRNDSPDDEQQRVIEQEFPKFFHISSLIKGYKKRAKRTIE